MIISCTYTQSQNLKKNDVEFHESGLIESLVKYSADFLAHVQTLQDHRPSPSPMRFFVLYVSV